ncbi:MAG: hypothetical protein HZB46_14135, partial [Solirubrobacterales bacterium]|nr:hypothetical protein [Solirubrobacterales bacterium]
PLLLLGAVAAVRLSPRPALGAAAGTLVIAGAAGVAVAQQEVPTSTPKADLPIPSRVWTTSDPRVLVPVAGGREDDRRDPATQTIQGRFAARCPGVARLSVTSGWERSTRAVTVPSRPGALVRHVRSASKALRRGRTATVARIRPAQPVVSQVRVVRAGRVVASLKEGCTGRPVAARWTPRARGTYTVEARVRSDRKTIVRRWTVRVR